MASWKSFTSILKDPPPSQAFEISEAGIAHARINGDAQIHFKPVGPDVVSPSPLRDNILQPDIFNHAVRSFAAGGSSKKRTPIALILPDFSSRVAVLDFDSFPSDPGEQLALVRFRMKKSVPFEVESAVVSYHAQQVADTKRYEVIVALAALEIVARYEAPFRAAGFHPGLVTVSTMAALNLAPPGSSVVARLSGRVLTVTVNEGPVLKLVRCVELPEPSAVEISGVLFPTFAYIEDQLSSRPSTLLLCGFGELGERYAPEWQSELSVTVAPLKSRFGPAGANNAGLLGFLEGQAS